MLKMITSGMFVVGMVTVPVALTPRQAPAPAPEYRNDPRLETLRTFFRNSDCPAAEYAAAFLEAADHNALDWRLLPSLSLSNPQVENRRHTIICSGGIPDARTSPPRLRASTRSATSFPIRTGTKSLIVSPQAGHSWPARACTRRPLFFSPFRSAAASPPNA